MSDYTEPVKKCGHVHDDSHHMCRISKMTDRRQIIAEYDQFAPKYDQHLDESGHKKQMVIDEVIRLVGNDRNLQVLDVACATGIGGELMRRAGFINVDGLDASESMLEIARSKKIYQRYICCAIQRDDKLPIEENTYDVVIIIGGFGLNHMQEECFEILSEVLKPGGFLVSISSVPWITPKQKLYEEAFRRFEAEGTLKLLSTVQVPEYLGDIDGIMYSFQKPEKGNKN